MPLSQDSPSRGLAAYFDNDPASENELKEEGEKEGGGEEELATCILSNLNLFNHHLVFRWDRNPPEIVFTGGFQARPRRNSPQEVYFSLDHHVHQGGIPLTGGLTENIPPHYFISTTTESDYIPLVRETVVGWRYELYVPGGIVVSSSLQNYQYPNQNEVAFPGKIRPRFVYSAQRFEIIPTGRDRTKKKRTDTTLFRNSAFNPEPDIINFRPLYRVSNYRVNGQSFPLEIVEI